MEKRDADELGRIADVYQARRRNEGRYDRLLPENYLARFEKDRCLIAWARASKLAPMRERRLLDIGCGSGDDLVAFMGIGFRPSHLVGIDLMPDCVDMAREHLPAAVLIQEGDALTADFPEQSFDVVYQSMVFTSILDASFARRLAQRLWMLVKPGGGVLWYDFAFDNPANPNVTGYPLSRIRTLFPAPISARWPLTLAPPISRRVTRLHPAMYSVLNVLPFLRTHRLCWIPKA